MNITINKYRFSYLISLIVASCIILIPISESFNSWYNLAIFYSILFGSLFITFPLGIINNKIKYFGIDYWIITSILIGFSILGFFTIYGLGAAKSPLIGLVSFLIICHLAKIISTNSEWKTKSEILFPLTSLIYNSVFFYLTIPKTEASIGIVIGIIAILHLFYYLLLKEYKIKKRL